MSDVAEWAVERLAAHHERGDFACGHPSLDTRLRQYAGQYDKRDLARTYVLVRPGQARVVGYYAISTRQLSAESVPAAQGRKLPRGADIPAVLIGRLAVDSPHRGRGLGGVLLIDALRRIQFLSDRVGIMAAVVDAIDDKARAFYLHHGFRSLDDDPRHLFLCVAEIRKLGLEPLAD